MRLKSAAGWNQVREDWALVAELSGGRSFACEVSGDVVGTAALIPFDTVAGRTIGWVGMVLVDPAHRRHGIGTRLLESVIDAAAAFDSVYLDATPAGQRVYEKLGFEAAFRLTRWTLEESACTRQEVGELAQPADHRVRTQGRSIEPMTEDDIPTCVELDSAGSGLRRPRLIEALRLRTPHAAVVHRSGDRIEGFSLGRAGSDAYQVGPVAARTEQAGEALVVAAVELAAWAGQKVIVDIPDGHPQTETLDALGFVQTRPFSRMSLRGDATPELSSLSPLLVAIAGPELG